MSLADDHQPLWMQNDIQRPESLLDFTWDHNANTDAETEV